MGDIYSSIALEEQTYPIIYRTEENDPSKIVEPVVDLVIDDYARASDPAVADDGLDSKDRDVRNQWERNNYLNLTGTGKLRIVIPEEGVDFINIVSGPALIEEVMGSVAEHNKTSGLSYGEPEIVIDPNQQVAARYDRTIDAIILNPAQLENPDKGAIDAAMQVRYDRSPETLRAELTAETEKFLENNLPPAAVRAGNRYRAAAAAARDELLEQGVPEGDPRIIEAMVSAAQPIWNEHVMRNPDNAREISKERAKLFEQEGTVLVTPDNYPELYREAREGTELLNAQYGLSYQPPMVVIKEGHVKDGSPASYMPDSDTIILDADYVRSNPRGIVGILGHELDHRYPNPDLQRKDLIREFSGQQPDASVEAAYYEAERYDEARADRSGALVAGDGDIVAGAAIMKDGLTDALIQANAYMEPIIERMRLEQQQNQPPIVPDKAGTGQASSAKDIDRRTHPSDEMRLTALDAIIASAQLSYNLRHDADALPHDPTNAATNSPPAVQNGKPVQTQVDGVGGR